MEDVKNEAKYFQNYLSSLLTPDLIHRIISLIIGVLVFTIIYIVIKKSIKKFLAPKIKIQWANLIRKTLKYTYMAIIVFYILAMLGVKLNALLGAAGIAGVAIGFAAQTSFSNIISGFFLLSEHALKIGDYISVGGESGVVDSIDLISVKIHTVDNQYIRIPNETIIKSNLVNNSFFDKRRIPVTVSVPYDVDLQKSIDVLKTVPDKCKLVLKDPAPIIYCDGFLDSGIKVVVAVWINRTNFIEVKNDLYITVKSTLEENNIQIPYPQIVVHTEDN